jgi:hypothetical protein
MKVKLRKLKIKADELLLDGIDKAIEAVSLANIYSYFVHTGYLSS